MTSNILNSELTSEIEYWNLLEDCRFEPGKPVIASLTQAGGTEVKRVMLKADTELKCHKTSEHVLVLWLRGKAVFTVNGESFTMHPGSMLEMPSGTPHGATAETDCVFAVFKIKTSGL